MVRGLVITDCKTVDDYLLVLKYAEGVTDIDRVKSYATISLYLDAGLPLWDDGCKRNFYYFWTYIKPRGTEITMEEFKKKYVPLTKSDLRKSIRKLKEYHV